MRNLLVRLLGWRATLLHGDPCVYERWRWLRRHLRTGRLRTLDAGCGSGAFTLFAANAGNDAVGISFDARNNEVARERARILGLNAVRFIDADLRELDRLTPELEPFDQIICLETIEHIRDDATLLSNLTRLLRPNGTLLLTTPFRDYRRMVGDEIEASETGGHVRWGYTHQEMERLFAESGLRVVSSEYVNGFVVQQLTNTMRIIGRLSWLLAWVVVLPLRPLRVLDRPLTTLLRYPYLNIAVVGVRTSGEHSG